MEGSGRKVGVALDYSSTSKQALQWAVDNFLRKGDCLFVIHVNPGSKGEDRHVMWTQSGSPLIPLGELKDVGLMKQYDLQPDAEVLDILDATEKEKEVSVFAKIYWGDAREKICESVDNLMLDCLVMGSRGLGHIKRILLGSVSNYVLQNAACPVTIVKDTN